jgi:ammonium transporter, Amt family
VRTKDLSQSEQKRQALRINRSKAASATSLSLLVWLCVGFHFGFVNGFAVSITALWMIAVAIVVFWLQTSNRNLEFSDPSFTQPLVFSAIACILGNAIFLDAASTSISFIWLLTAIAFSTFTSNPRSIMQSAYLTGMAICVCGYLQYHLQPGRSGAVMIWQGSAFIGAVFSIAVYGVWFNTNKSKNRRRQLLADQTISSMTDAVINLDTTGAIVSFNPAAERLFNMSRNGLSTQSIQEILNKILVTPDDRQANWLIQNCRARTTHTVRGRTTKRAISAQPIKVTFEGNIKIDRYITKRRIEATLNSVSDDQGENTGQLVLFKDVTEQFNLMQQLNFDSTHDSMTGMLNRRGFEAKLDELHAYINAAPKNTQITVAMLDLDNLKIVNDTCGHDAGDSLIEQTSKIIRHQILDTDVAARYGGDEFAFIFYDTTHMKVKETCERILATIKEINFQWEDKLFKTGASVGCINLSSENFSREHCLSKADSALYLAKELGKGRVQFHDLDDAHISDKSAALNWAWKINDAIEKNQFQLFAQRVISFDASWEDHFEVLLRLKTDQNDIVPPIDFLPAAERFHLMPSIDRWVIENSLQAMQEFHVRNGRYPKIAINLSAQSLVEVGFLDFVISNVASSKVPADCVCFELTETVAIGNFSGARQFIEQVRLLGCEFHLDDVGAGFNSFSYLSELTFDAIKIDGHYIKDMLSNDANRGIVESLVRASKSRGLHAIAEMIEDKATATALIEMGVTDLQGYYFHRPEPILAAFASTEPKTKSKLRLATVDSY